MNVSWLMMLCCYRIICVTGSTSKPTNGSVTVTIGDQTSVATNITFMYKVSF